MLETIRKQLARMPANSWNNQLSSRQCYAHLANKANSTASFSNTPSSVGEINYEVDHIMNIWQIAFAILGKLPTYFSKILGNWSSRRPYYKHFAHQLE